MIRRFRMNVFYLQLFSALSLDLYLYFALFGLFKNRFSPI